MINTLGHKPTQQGRGSIRSHWRRESGQSLVELGILMPVLIIVLIGIVDFGQILMIKHAITNAAREGARVAVVGDQNTSSDPTATVQSYLQAAGIDTSKASITVSGTTASSGQPVVVTISYQVTSMTMQMLPLVNRSSNNNNFTLTATSTMTHE